MEDNLIKRTKLHLINKNHIIYIFIIILTLYKKSFQTYFDSFTLGNLTDSGKLVEIRDYKNQYLIISTSKSIYAGLNPELKTVTSAKLKEYSFGATYNKTIILFSCLEDSLLSKVNMTSGEEEQILKYDVLKKVLDISEYSLSSCSLSIDNEIVYLAISYNQNSSPNNYRNLLIKTDVNYKPNLTPEIINIENLNNENENNSRNESNQQNETSDDGLIIYSFHDDITVNATCAPKISCETISNKLVCAIVSKNIYNSTYSVYGIIINDDFDNLENIPKKINDFSSMPDFKLHKINNTCGRLVMNSLSVDIKIIQDESNYKIDSSIKPPYIGNYDSYKNLFDYNNKHIFFIFNGSDLNYFAIKKNVASHFIRIDNLESANKIIGYWDEDTDKYIFIYQTLSSIKYFNIENLKDLFSISSSGKEHKLITNESISVNITEVISYTGTYNYEKLHLYTSIYYLSTLNHSDFFPENSYSYDYDNQEISINGSLNNWYSFSFAFQDTISDYPIYFVLESSTIFFKTCKYNCGWCLVYENCFGCKVNFSRLIDGDEDDCLPIEQNVKYYVYNKTTDYFEKCYKSCLFCSLMDAYSSELNHNCLTCKDGYLPSYIHQGNCYQINQTIQNKNYPKIVENKTDENFTEVSSCYDISKIYIIDHTGECTSECPTYSKYYNFVYDKSVDLDNQSYTQLKLQYISKADSAPKYLYGNICYQTCPKYSIQIEKENICKCNFTWTQNETTKEIICNGGSNKCVDIENKFLLTDTKECVPNDCPVPYYRYNYDCYRECPDDFTYVNEDKKLCICKYPWYNNTEGNETVCVIGELECTYENHKYLLYDTKECIIENCPENYYRYNFICFRECPDYTTVDEENKMCKCKYAWHYDETKDIINCYDGQYKCINNNYKYLLYDTKECIKTNCPNQYYTFGYHCYTACPEYTLTDNVNMKCKCYHAWHQDITTGEINCYNEEKCINSEYNYFLIDTKECIQNGCPDDYYTFGYLCYKTCPALTNANDLNKKCECIHSWHQDINTKEIICYENEDYCKENDYKFFVIDTKECVNNGCPENYYRYNFTCYNNCPDYTEEDTNSKTCKCKYTWQQNTTDEITCNINKETCILNEYNYLVLDTKECVKNKCPTNYYQYNYKCYNDGCPSNTEPYPDNEFECKKACPTGTFLIENTDNCIQNCPDKYYFNEKRKIFSPCLSQCSKCDYNGTLVNACIECENNFGYFSAVEKNYVKCYKCEGEGTKIDISQNKCVIVCKHKFYFNNMNLTIECLGNDDLCPGVLPYQNNQYLDECLEACSYQYQKEGLCEINKITPIVVNRTLNDIKDIISNKNYSILDESSKGDGLIIEGNGLIIQVITSDAMKNNTSNNISSIDLGECENILKKYYKINSILILKTDIKSEKAKSTSVQYELYHPTERYKLDTSLCGNTKIKISVPVNLSTEIENLYKNLSAQGYDVFNSEDDFYNDVCATYTSDNNTDILLSDRKHDFYDENLTFCQEGCQYYSYNPDTKKVDCECDVQTAINTTNIGNEKFENKISASFFDPMSNSNLKIFVCYKLVFSWKGLKKNTGGILMIVIMIISVVLAIVYYLIERKNIANILNDILNYKRKQYKINLSKRIILDRQKTIEKMETKEENKTKKAKKTKKTRKAKITRNSKKRNKLKKSEKRKTDSNNNDIMTEERNLKNTNAPPKKEFIKSGFNNGQKRIKLSVLNFNNDENIEDSKNENIEIIENNENINYSSINDNNINNNNSNNEYMGSEDVNFYENILDGISNDNEEIVNGRKNVNDNTINHQESSDDKEIKINSINSSLNSSSKQNSSNYEDNNFNSKIITTKEFEGQSSKLLTIQNITNSQFETKIVTPKSKLSSHLFPRQHIRQKTLFIQNENDNTVIPQKLNKSFAVSSTSLPMSSRKQNKLKKQNNNFFKSKNASVLGDTKEKFYAHMNNMNKSQNSNNNIKIVSFRNLDKKFVIHNEVELNSMDYEEAILYDKRSFLGFYWSLLKSKQLILFTFCNNGDYNLLTIKICLFLFSFSLLLAVNALFFDDDSMHKLYKNNGKYELLYQIPQIVYSTLVSNVAQILIEFLSLHGEKILQIRTVEKIDGIVVSAKKKYKCIVIKFHLFFLALFSFNFLFWYFISCFCAVYKNTQWALIKDTLVSFILSLFYPFGTCLITAFLRIISLRDKNKNKKCLFKISRLIT